MNDLPDVAPVIARLPEWIEDYNRSQPHKGLKMKSRWEYRAKLASSEWDGVRFSGGDYTTVPNQIWSMDFLGDQLFSGKAFRTFNVINDYHREGWALKLTFHNPAQRVIRALDQLIEWRVRTDVSSKVLLILGSQFLSAPSRITTNELTRLL